MSGYTLRTVRIAAVAEAIGSAGGPDEALGVLRAVFATLDADREHFVILALDAKNAVRGFKTCATGGQSMSCIDPKTLFRDALALGAAALIVAHNHPSGDPAPSPEDKATTKQLCEGGALLGMPIRDHIVLGDGGRYFSFRREGLMPSY